MIANEERGEVEVQLEGDKPRPLRPSYEAIIAIERDLDTTLQSLTARSVTIAFLTIEEIGTILYHGMVAAGKDRNDSMLKSVSPDKLKRMAYETGVTNLHAPIGTFLRNALSGGKPPKKEEASQTQLSLATGG